MWRPSVCEIVNVAPQLKRYPLGCATREKSTAVFQKTTAGAVRWHHSHLSGKLAPDPIHVEVQVSSGQGAAAGGGIRASVQLAFRPPFIIRDGWRGSRVRLPGRT